MKEDSCDACIRQKMYSQIYEEFLQINEKMIKKNVEDLNRHFTKQNIQIYILYVQMFSMAYESKKGTLNPQ